MITKHDAQWIFRMSGKYLFQSLLFLHLEITLPLAKLSYAFEKRDLRDLRDLKD